MSTSFHLEYDTTGLKPANRIVSERHRLPFDGRPRLIVTHAGPYFYNSVSLVEVKDTGERVSLVKDRDYLCVEPLERSTRTLGQRIDCIILILSESDSQNWEVTYQALGGPNHPNVVKLREIITSLTTHAVQVEWKNIIAPKQFEVRRGHLHDILDVYGVEYLRDSIQRLVAAVRIGDYATHVHLQSLLKAKLDAVSLEGSQGIDTREITRVAQRAEGELLATQRVLTNMGELIESAQKKGQACLEHAGWYTPMVTKADKSAILLKTMKVRREAGQGLMKMPLLMGNLALWLSADAGNVRNDSGAWQVTSQDPSGRVYEGAGAPLTLDRAGGKCWSLNMEGLRQVSGSAMSLGTETTVILVSAPHSVAPGLGRDANESIEVLGDIQHSVTLDLAQGRGWRWIEADDTLVEYPQGTHAVPGVRLSLLTTSFDHRRPFGLSSDPANVYDDPPVYIDSLTSESWFPTRVLCGRGYVKELIVYDRRLSAWELELISQWLRYKHNQGVNLISNGHFLSELSEFETELNVKSIHLEKDGALALKHRFFGDTGRYFVPDGTQELLKRLPLSEHALAVCVSAPRKVWSQPHRLDAYITHRLSLVVCLDPNLPVRISAHYAGKELPAKATAVSQGVIRLTWDFLAVAEVAELSLVVRPETDLGKAALYQIELRRHHVD